MNGGYFKAVNKRTGAIYPVSAANLTEAEHITRTELGPDFELKTGREGIFLNPIPQSAYYPPGTPIEAVQHPNAVVIARLKASEIPYKQQFLATAGARHHFAQDWREPNPAPAPSSEWQVQMMRTAGSAQSTRDYTIEKPREQNWFIRDSYFPAFGFDFDRPHPQSQRPVTRQQPPTVPRRSVPQGNYFGGPTVKLYRTLGKGRIATANVPESYLRELEARKKKRSVVRPQQQRRPIGPSNGMMAWIYGRRPVL